MEWLSSFHVLGYCIGFLGILLLIWSLFKQGVSLLGLVLLTLGFLLLAITDGVVYFVLSASG
jgi:hypothetical protein